MQNIQKIQTKLFKIGVFCFPLILILLLQNLSSDKQHALWLNFLSASATVLGALPLLFFKEIPQKFFHSFLGFSAGMMLSASLFSLLIPALEQSLHSPILLGFLVFSFYLGVKIMQKIDLFLPHAHVENLPHHANLFLVVWAIFIHNLPEGFAVASAQNQSITWGIALQNIPEGAIVASALLSLGKSKTKAVFWALISGLAECVGGVLGIVLLGWHQTLLPFSLSAAAGAMLWVVFHEMLPVCYANHKLGLVFGIFLMAILSLFL